MRTSKNTRLGILATAGAGVAGLAIAGFALPATADTTSATDVQQSESTTDFATTLGDFQSWVGELVNLTGTDVSPVTGVSPETGIGDVTLVEGPLVGDIASGNQAPIASGNEVGDITAPIGSGNDTSAPIGSGNDVSAPIEAPIEAPVGNGTEAGNGNSTGNGNSADTSTGDLGADISNDVNDVVDNVTGDLDNTIDDVTGSLGLGGLLD